jgi:hypothetical protein
MKPFIAEKTEQQRGREYRTDEQRRVNDETELNVFAMSIVKF